MTPNTTIRNRALRGLGLFLLATLGACSLFGGSPPPKPAAHVHVEGDVSAEEDIDLNKVRADLSQLEADPQLAPRAPAAIKEAEQAYAAANAERGGGDFYLYLAYIADRKEQTARALAESKVAEDQLKDLRGQ